MAGRRPRRLPARSSPSAERAGPAAKRARARSTTRPRPARPALPAGLPAGRSLPEAGEEAGPRGPAEHECAVLPRLRVAHHDYSRQVPGDFDALAAIAAAMAARMPIGTGQVDA